VTLNFLNHLKERHRSQYDEYLVKRTMTKRARIGGSRQSVEKVLKFALDTFVALLIVDYPSFTDLFDSNLIIPGRIKLTGMLDDKFESHKHYDFGGNV